MYLLHIVFNPELFCTILLGIVAIFGDFLVSHSKLAISKAIFDNSTHCIIGALTWLIISLNTRHKTVLFRMSEVGLCGFIASVIDLDHFISARSLYLQDATNLQTRPPMHCTTIPLIFTSLLLGVSKYLFLENLYRFAWIFFAAFISHHIRDATRRGLWFYPMGSTPPLPYFSYVVLTMALPHFISYFMKVFYIQLKYYDSIHLDV